MKTIKESKSGAGVLFMQLYCKMPKKKKHTKESKRANTAQEPEEAAGCY